MSSIVTVTNSLSATTSASPTFASASTSMARTATPTCDPRYEDCWTDADQRWWYTKIALAFVGLALCFTIFFLVLWRVIRRRRAAAAGTLPHSHPQPGLYANDPQYVPYAGQYGQPQYGQPQYGAPQYAPPPPAYAHPPAYVAPPAGFAVPQTRDQKDDAWDARSESEMPILNDASQPGTSRQAYPQPSPTASGETTPRGGRTSTELPAAATHNPFASGSGPVSPPRSSNPFRK